MFVPKPSTSEAPIGTLTQGTSVVIVGESGNWYQIEFNNKTAYVSKDYITFTAPTPEVVKKTGYVYNLDGTLLNVRPKPSTSEAPIGTLAQGTSVVIVGKVEIGIKSNLTIKQLMFLKIILPSLLQLLKS